jgi:hypothetical protein
LVRENYKKDMIDSIFKWFTYIQLFLV